MTDQKLTEVPTAQTVKQDDGSQLAPISPAAPSSASEAQRSIKREDRTRAGAKKSKRRPKAGSSAQEAGAKSGQTPQSRKRTSDNRHDWNAIRTRYIIGNEDLREIAEKIPCSKSNIMAHSKKEGWPKLREEYRRDLDAETVRKAAAETATERARIARIAVGGMGAISQKWKRMLWKMENQPPEVWEKDPEIVKLSATDYEKLVKAYMLLVGEATERHELKEKMTQDTAAAIWRLMASDNEQEEGEK